MTLRIFQFSDKAVVAKIQAKTSTRLNITLRNNMEVKFPTFSTMAQWKAITYQHCRAKIKFMEKLGNKNMDLKDVGNIFLLDIPQNLNEPLKMTMWWADPQEVHLQFYSWYSVRS